MSALIKALLSGIGVKDYIYGALILAAIGAITGWFIHHNHLEQAIGRQQIEAQDKKLADITAKHNVAVTASAQILSDNLGDLLAKTIASPIADSPHVLCDAAAAPRRGVVPASARDQEPGNAQAPGIPAAYTVDIGPTLDAVGRDADAQVNALIDEIIVLRNLLNGIKQ
jgi:hypothetical protein